MGFWDIFTGQNIIKRIDTLEELLMARIDEIKAQLAEIGNDITEIDGDVQEVLDKLAGSNDGLTAAEVAEVASMLTDLKARTRATADKVPEPPTT